LRPCLKVRVDPGPSKGFDWELRFTPAGLSPDAPGAGGPSIFTALEEQLGLKLVPKNGLVEVLVIDEIRQPAAN
jgi:uncharacterized protein (TIGR03435 family)